uniref:Uncharacterized protein n=1 Tax=Anguilla anguilla TaxID=7936 RepID=A0A0E9RC35_ANGAN
MFCCQSKMCLWSLTAEQVRVRSLPCFQQLHLQYTIVDH